MQDMKSRLLEATFQEVFSKGYTGAKLANILKEANAKKGGMYHYFPSKKAMVIEMIEEKIEKRIEKKWQELLKCEENILSSFIFILNDTDSWNLKEGCPLGNLLQETLEDDEDFKEVLINILNNWQKLFASILLKAQEKNQLKKDIDINQCSLFLISSIQGALLLNKKYTDNLVFTSCIKQLTLYLETLRFKESNENI